MNSTFHLSFRKCTTAAALAFGLVLILEVVNGIEVISKGQEVYMYHVNLAYSSYCFNHVHILFCMMHAKAIEIDEKPLKQVQE